jgi:6-phosphogluconolactonase
MARTLRVFADLDALSDAALREVQRQVEQSIRARGRFTMALAGGNTPRALYARLAQQPDLPWPQIELWFGDERAVPLDDPASNAGMVRAVLSSRPFVSQANVQHVRTALPLAEAAADYEQRLRQRFFEDGAFPRFDLVLLGLGSDGHTASLFPHAPALRERRAWVSTHAAEPPSPARITLTLPVLNHARAVLFLVSGADKAEALRRVFEHVEAHASAGQQGDPGIDEIPARGIAPARAVGLFLVDRAAASALPASP